MADEKYTFEQARIRLEEIAAEVRKKDTSLEKSLDLLEEGVRLANICTELVDHPDVSASVPVPVSKDVAEVVDGSLAADDDVDSETDADNGAAPVEGDGASPGDVATASDDAASSVAAPGFDTDGFEDVEEPSVGASEEDTQD